MSGPVLPHVSPLAGCRRARSGLHGNYFPGERAFIPSNLAAQARCSRLRRERTPGQMFTASRMHWPAAGTGSGD